MLKRSHTTTNSICGFKPGGLALFLGDSLVFSYKDLDVEQAEKTVLRLEIKTVLSCESTHLSPRQVFKMFTTGFHRLSRTTNAALTSILFSTLSLWSPFLHTQALGKLCLNSVPYPRGGCVCWEMSFTFVSPALLSPWSHFPFPSHPVTVLKPQVRPWHPGLLLFHPHYTWCKSSDITDTNQGSYQETVQIITFYLFL